MTNKSDRISTTERSDATELRPDPVMEARKRHIDRTLLRENLKRTIEQRFLKLGELQRLSTELRKAGSRSVS